MSLSGEKVLFFGGSVDVPQIILEWMTADGVLVVEESEARAHGLWLGWSGSQLLLYFVGDNGEITSVGVDFLSGGLLHRRRFGMGKKQLFGKALGLQVKPKTALDLTAGFGTDAFVMNCFGIDVTSIERNPTIFRLLQDGYRRAQSDPDIGLSLADSLKFINSEALEYLKAASDKSYDLVYYDPMFPEKKKQALAKKEMQALQRLLVVEEEEQQRLVMIEAMRVAKKRVIVKRPLKADPIVGSPTNSCKGKSVRYDIYLSRPQ